MPEPNHSSPLRKVAAFRDLPSLLIPERAPNQPSYPRIRPSPGERNPDETLLPPTSLSPPDINGRHANWSINSWLSKLPDVDTTDMFQFPEKLGSVPSPPAGSPPSWPAKSRMAYWSLTPRKIALIFAGCFAIWALKAFWSLTSHQGPRRPAYLMESLPYNASFVTNAAFQPPEPLPHRYPDTIDTFATYKYRNTCNISSLDLHAPFAPLCADRKSMITAMSSGGRIGNDAPYMPRDCDMRWFSTEEICEILGRFEKVIIIGDSMMRHVIGSINVLVRKDIGYGAVTDWNFSPEERRDCFCNHQFNIKACSVQGIFKTSDVFKNDPSSLACPANTVDVMIEQMIRFPVPAEEINRLRDDVPSTKPSRPYAFIFGHGLWNDLDLQATLDWLDQVLDAIISKAAWVSSSASSPSQNGGKQHNTAFWPRLFLTPNAAGKEKPDEWLVSQGNKALMIFEEAVGIEVKRRGVEHLGTWNMSIQSNKFDGVHMDLKGNLVKAMMIMNWLNMLEVEQF
ncbi:hypothetical protein MMC22_008625 [Lobaria immixta]|nr:hypothetical protein [Lobaria immixta]